ncbi:MAG: hypothetical protein NXI01_04405 [Gammaproteobacteria bacterium]|nr:hypothetical protein [Gammaproteobacteria bacterium]
MLKKGLVLYCIVACGVGFALDETYYYQHPTAIETALSACPLQQPDGVSCKTLRHIAKETNRLFIELGQTPQKYGLNILLAQEKIAKQQNKIQAMQPSSERDKAAQVLLLTQQALHARLALIALLQTPGGAG